jgi:hypothetical protein
MKKIDFKSKMEQRPFQKRVQLKNQRSRGNRINISNYDRSY